MAAKNRGGGHTDQPTGVFPARLMIRLAMARALLRRRALGASPILASAREYRCSPLQRKESVIRSMEGVIDAAIIMEGRGGDDVDAHLGFGIEHDPYT